MACCKIPEHKTSAPDRCRQCNGQGRRLSRETMESLLKPEAVSLMQDVDYFFDPTPDCNVVYFSNQADSYFTKDALTVRVGIKESEPPISICYCFGHTLESAREELWATGRSTVAERITAEVQAGKCSCDVKNPSGKCCLGDVHRVVKQIREEMKGQTVAQTEERVGL